jgi:UTP--glucose-1-phosphate uridylyltransferase
MNKKVRKAVIPAAGFGTRFLPQTKAMPKEMLPLVDKPIIQYIVEQLVDAGIEDIIIVTGYSKRNIEDHFDTPNEDLLNDLRAGGPSKAHLLDEMRNIADLANFVYVRQKGPRGLATPLMNVAPLIDNEPFIYALPDDLAIAEPNYFKQMIALYNELGGNILPCIRVAQDEIKKYGIVGGEQLREDVIKINRIIEKPSLEEAPSDFASVMGYLLSPEIFAYIERGQALVPAGKEFQLTDHVIQPMLASGKAFYGCEIKNSIRYDTGNSLGYLQAVIDFALRRDDVGPQLRDYLRKKLQ